MGGATTVAAEPARAVSVDGARLELQGPCWFVEDAVSSAPDVGAPRLLALACYGEGTCHVHCAHLNLQDVMARAAPVPSLVGAARPHAVVVARGRAAPRMLVVSEVNIHARVRARACAHARISIPAPLLCKR